MCQVAEAFSELEVLTVQEVARTLRVTPMTVYRLCYSGEIDHYRIGKSVRIPRRELEKYLRKANEQN